MKEKCVIVLNKYIISNKVEKIRDWNGKAGRDRIEIILIINKINKCNNMFMLR